MVQRYIKKIYQIVRKLKFYGQITNTLVQISIQRQYYKTVCHGSISSLSSTYVSRCSAL